MSAASPADTSAGLAPVRARMTHKLRKVAHLYREGGLRGCGAAVGSVVQSWVYHEESHVLLVRPLSDVPDATSSERLEVRSMDSDDVEAVLAFSKRHDAPKVTARVRNYLSNGYRAFLGFRDGELIGVFWWVDRGIDPDHPDLVLHGMRLAKADAYGYAYFIAPEHRGRGTATDFIASVFSTLRDAGYQQIWGWVRADNLPARWLFSLMGYEEQGLMRTRTLLSLVTLAQRRLLVRNFGWRSRHNFGWRPLVPIANPEVG